MTPEEEGREKALRYYRILAVITGLLGAALLILAIVAVVKEKSYSEDTWGPPYYVGGFVVGILSLVSALLCTCVIIKGSGADSDVKKRELACTMYGHYIVSMFTLMGCFSGTVLAGVGGFSTSFLDDETDEYYKTKRVLAGVILALCIVSLIVVILSLCTVCTYGSYFGVVIQNRRGGRVVIWTNNGTGTNGPVTVHTTAYGMGGMNTTQFGMNSGNNDRVRQLEQENRLLQQQLELQRQLNQQNPSFYPPPPPPNYGFSHPSASAPPPSYDSVKYS